MKEEKNTVEQCCVTSCEKPLDAAYWNSQYQSAKIGWDLGEVSPPIKAYINQLNTKDLAILIPGCGNTYEATYLLQQGFTNITVIDIAPVLIQNLREKFANNANIRIIEEDFFHHKGQYDLMLEQTFFCAINPSLRQAYADKMSELLVKDGKLIGVLFDKEFDFAGPPFGGCKCKYTGYFETYFAMPIFEPCYNSHASRENIELFVKLTKK
jgi:methyl halide transferase